MSSLHLSVFNYLMFIHIYVYALDFSLTFCIYVYKQRPGLQKLALLEVPASPNALRGPDVRREEGISPSPSSTSQGRHQEIAGPVQGRQLRGFLTPWSNGHPAVGPVPPRGMGWPAGGLQLICKLLLRATEESALF